MMRDAKQCRCALHPNCGHWNPPDSNFCEMCGCRLAAVITAFFKLAGGSIPLELEETGTPIELGRANFIQLIGAEKSRFISRRHFAVKCEGGKFAIMDLGSKNGTKVNGIDIRGRGWTDLRPGDKVTLADEIELTFTL